MTALSLRRPPAWAVHAACAGMAAPDLDPWLPDDDLPADVRGRLQGLALDVCSRCPVRPDCLQDALATGEAWSIRGGTTPADRRRLAGEYGFRRPSPAGASQHGQRSTYVGGCHCPPCTAANTAYNAGLRERQRWAATDRGLLVPVRVLERPVGRGHGKAWPGQLAIAWEAAA